MIKVNYNLETGDILGYYPDNINYQNIPAPYLVIDEQQHILCINSKFGYKVIEGSLIEGLSAPNPTQKQLKIQSLLDHYSTFSTGVQAMLEPIKNAVLKALQNDNKELALDIIKTVPLQPEMEMSRQAFIDMLNEGL